MAQRGMGIKAALDEPRRAGGKGDPFFSRGLGIQRSGDPEPVAHGGTRWLSRKDGE